jgi:protein-tyrosine-phosphatase
MIDQASVFADRFRNNRQALQAAVLGQNSGVDPYTALRALQLLKESDSMQMAQQGQQPTEAPSLLQEAMQPPQMPMGMAVPGQQMSQAPQQSGGLEAIPVPDQMFSGAGGGIVAFAAGDSIPGPKDVKERWQDMKRRPDETPTEFLRRVEAAKQKDFQAQGPAKFKQSLEEALKSAQDAKSDDSSKSETQGMIMPGYDNTTPGKGETWDYLKREQKAYDVQKENQLNRFLTGNIDVEAAAEKAAAAALQAETAALSNRYPAPAPSIAVGDGGGDGRRTSGYPGPDVSSVVSAADPATGFRQTSSTPPTPRSLTASAASADGVQLASAGNASTNNPPADDFGLAAAQKALIDAGKFTPKLITNQTPEARDKAITAETEAQKKRYGKDKYSDEAREIIKERTADLTNPDRNKFDKALAWFKGAAAMQKGRGLESIANAAAEVAGSYSVIKKEDRKEKNAIRDMNLNLTKAEQARSDGFIDKATTATEKAEAARIAADAANNASEQAKAKITAMVAGSTLTSATQLTANAATNAANTANNIRTTVASTRANELTNELRKIAEQNLFSVRETQNISAAQGRVTDIMATFEREMNKGALAQAEQDIKLAATGSGLSSIAK